MTHPARRVAHHISQSKAIKLLAKLALTLAAFWFALRDVDFSQLADILKQQRLSGLAEASVLILAQIVLGGIRWRLVLKAMSPGGKLLTWWEAVKLNYISVFFNCCLPATIGGDVVRVWLAKSQHIPLQIAINSVIIDRIIALIGLGLLVMFSLPWLGDAVGIDGYILIAAAAAGALLAWSGIVYAPRLLKAYEHVRPVSWLLHFIHCLRMLLAYPAATVVSLLCAVFSHVGFCLATYVVLRSLHVDVALIDCLTLIPLVILLAMLPISFGGWGVREAGMVGMLALAGVPRAGALTASLEVALLNMLVTVPGALLWLAYRRRSERA